VLHTDLPNSEPNALYTDSSTWPGVFVELRAGNYIRYKSSCDPLSVTLDSDQNIYEQCINLVNSLCGLVVTVPGYRFRGPGSISGATRFSEQ
jgi:hypothetical protein